MCVNVRSMWSILNAIECGQGIKHTKLNGDQALPYCFVRYISGTTFGSGDWDLCCVRDEYKDRILLKVWFL